MTIRVNIGEAKTRLSELVAAAIRGEEVVLARAGEPLVRLVMVEDQAALAREARAARRRSAFGMWKGRIGDDDAVVPTFMTDDEVDARWSRKLGPAA